MRFKVLAWLLLVVVAGLLLAFFITQNQLRVTDLSLNLGFGMWHLASPVSVPWLLLWTTVGGFLVGFVVGLLFKRSRRTDRADLPAPGGVDDAWT